MAGRDACNTYGARVSPVGKFERWEEGTASAELVQVAALAGSSGLTPGLPWWRDKV